MDDSPVYRTVFYARTKAVQIAAFVMFMLALNAMVVGVMLSSIALYPNPQNFANSTSGAVPNPFPDTRAASDAYMPLRLQQLRYEQCTALPLAIGAAGLLIMNSGLIIIRRAYQRAKLASHAPLADDAAAACKLKKERRMQLLKRMSRVRHAPPPLRVRAAKALAAPSSTFLEPSPKDDVYYTLTAAQR